jgi:hypothetical protein
MYYNGDIQKYINSDRMIFITEIFLIYYNTTVFYKSYTQCNYGINI